MDCDVRKPASEENNFCPYIEICHAIIIGTLRTVTEASSNKLALVKFLSLTRAQLAVDLMLSIARFTWRRYSIPSAAYIAQRRKLLSWKAMCSCSFSTNEGETPRISREGINKEMQLMTARKVAVVFLVISSCCLWGILTPMYWHSDKPSIDK